MRWFVNHRPGATNGRHSLSHARWACQLPQRGSREWVRTIQPTARKAERCGRFSSPLRKLRGGYISPFNGGHSLSLLRCQLPQRGSREWVRTIQHTARKPQDCGRFSSPLRDSECFTFHHTTERKKASRVLLGKRYRVCQGIYRIGTIPKRNKKGARHE